MAVTTGLVQRVKWVSGLDVVFAYLGPKRTAVRLYLIRFAGADPVDLAFRRACARVLVDAYAAGLPVTITFDDLSSDIQQIDLRFTQIRPEGLEVTQAIQNLTHSVPLIALKRTVVRAYLSYRLSPAVVVRGTLTVRRLPTGASVQVASENSVTLDVAEFGQLDLQRNAAARSLNFVLPFVETAPGRLEVSLTEVVDVATNTRIDAPFLSSTVTVDFVASPPLRLRIIGISYEQGAPPVRFAPRALDFDLLVSWLTRAYPVAQVIGSDVIVPATAAAPFGCGDINAQVAAIRALDVAGGVDPRTHYYGLVSDVGFFMRGCAAVPGVPDPSAVGSGPTGTASWGWDFDGSYGDWYGGHELGHTFGRKHPGFCGESSDDPNYPFANGQLSDGARTFAGFDVGDPIRGLPMVALPGTVWRDVMTYCSNQWLSSYTYLGIRTRLLAEDALGAFGGGGRPDERFKQGSGVRTGVPGPKRRLIHVVATINHTQQVGKIRHVTPLPRGQVAGLDPSSPIVVEAKRADGELLEKYGVSVKDLSDSPCEDNLGLLDVIMAVPFETRRIDLLMGAKVVDTFAARGVPLGLRDVKPVMQRAGHDLALSWQSGSAGDAGHTYIVQASPDGGRTWQTLALGLASPSISVDTRRFGDAPVVIRIIETDGFDSVEVTHELAPGDLAPKS